MYKMIIADDEKNIRLGIQAMINREFPDTFETVVASDGQEVLDLMEQVTPHIVITDIKMPRMSGIELIQAIQQREEKAPALVILSGYDDFVYTKEAIKANVKDYLLKPVNRSELFQTLNNIMHELETAEEEADQFLDGYRTSQLNYMLLNPNSETDGLEHFYENMQIEPFVHGYYVGIAVTEERGINQWLKNEGLSGKILSFRDSEGRNVIVVADRDIFDKLNEYLKRDRHSSFSIGISGHTEEIKDIKRAYEQADKALKYRFIYPRSTKIAYDEVADKEQVPELPLENIKKIYNMLGTDREKEIKEYLKEILEYELVEKRDISYLEDISKEINNTIFESFFARLGEESVETFKLFNKIGNLYSFENYHEYCQALEKLLMRLHEYNKQMKSVYSEQKYMDKAIDYIKENYYKDLNLAVVSNYISLNYSYFSHMFKEYTGQNFVDYLKEVRVGEAKKLLIETDDKVFEISEKVGYKNPKQFARVFREIEGISPKEYRQK
ncbi:response regulator [Fictibacillus iocasae]|uniref:Response regulator n=1 Tax=Fictibacillus iocasae TaxID=2715437 RepID=A0ABW2NXR8_9BACL